MAKAKKSPARAASAKKKVIPVPTKFHLDQRADQILADAADASDDELLTTKEMAVWFRNSVEWWEIGRVKGYGPPWCRVSPRNVRYPRGLARAWLKARIYNSTKEYA